ncbi:MAG: CDGSH iron-sulfur domain-containing protein [Candidatus Methanoplasma sp.]|jgi:CDGSH-type Zn-finger protein|nr:CDGSH iron-sulfur domain-containing protein [Candidatus Methanoplasma sp.]
MSDDMRIVVTKDGPYMVYGSPPLFLGAVRIDGLGRSLEWKKGERLYPDEIYALCRCGKSKNKPFCDGSHVNGFDGAETAPRDGYEGRANIEKGTGGMDLLQDPALCTGSGFCHAQHSISKTVQKEKTVHIAKQQCADCAGGSLTLRIDGKLVEEDLPKEILVTATPRKEGPIRVTGGIPIESEDGKAYEVRNRVALCRCGRSGNMPFCNGRHLKA